MTKILESPPQRVTPGVLAEDERGNLADVLRAHDLVGLAMRHHAVLMNASLMRKRVRANDRLVSRDRLAGQGFEQARRGVKKLRVDAQLDSELVLAGAQGHRHLFERRVARALPDTADRRLDLTRSAADGSKAIRNRRARGRVAVAAEDRGVDPRDFSAEAGEQDLGFMSRRSPPCPVR